jgi:transcriptional regulator with XRE-family HTH domain
MSPRTFELLVRAIQAKKLGKTQSYISKIESGQRRFNVLQLKEFAKLYKNPLDFSIK